MKPDTFFHPDSHDAAFSSAINSDENKRILSVNRRTFLQTTLTVTGSLLISLYLPTKALFGEETIPHFQPNPFIRIDPDNTITIWLARSELGQGVRTALPMVITEELEADWSTIKIEQALADQKYGSQTTGGSHSIDTSWEPIRNAAATAREILLIAAAQKLSVPKEECKAEKAHIFHQPTGKKIPFGDLVEIAATIQPPENVTYKEPKDYRLIGQNVRRVDGPAIVNGKATYGMDVKLPGMLYAAIQRCPVFQGRLVSFDDTQARKIKGVLDVIVIDPVGPGVSSPGGVAVIAESSWAALQAKDALKVKWDLGENSKWSTSAIQQHYQECAKKDGISIYKSGEETNPSDQTNTINAEYESSYLAHITMEPMNCTADVKPDSCEVWAPSQSPLWAQWEIRRLTWLPPDAIKVHIPLVGGGFGRRLKPDFVVEAVQISKKLQKPVKVVWSREDDIRHDFFHPGGLHKMSASVDKDGYPVSWQHKIIEPHNGVFFNSNFVGAPDPQSVPVPYFPYDIPQIEIDYVFAHVGIRVGWWRSVDKQRYAFPIECFVDELAHAAKIDPVQYRLKLLEKQRELKIGEDRIESERLKKVIELAAEKANWGKTLPEGHAQGIACYSYSSCQTYVAEIAEISLTEKGAIKVHKVTGAVDCGIAINPVNIKAQFEGGIVFGLSAILFPPITFANGTAQQSNFNDYKIPRLKDAPKVEVHIIQSEVAPGGIGEPCIPPLAPAIANALFSLTGKRIRRLPLVANEINKGGQV